MGMVYIERGIQIWMEWDGMGWNGIKLGILL
jgi:hypothetical protein